VTFRDQGSVPVFIRNEAKGFPTVWLDCQPTTVTTEMHSQSVKNWEWKIFGVLLFVTREFVTRTAVTQKSLQFTLSCCQPELLIVIRQLFMVPPVIYTYLYT
jgi:hypothetical protein